jgi:sec-independent protein translocase protein TatC
MQESDQETTQESNSMSFMSHLVELRDRLLRIVLSVLFIFLCLFYWANDIYTYLAEPLTRHMPEGSKMIAIDVASPFLTPFKLVLMLSVFLAMPFILYQIWGFIAPGLYKHEKKLAGPLLASSIILFYCGMLFAYYVVFPLVFGFFTSVGPEIVSISTDIGRYLDFVLSLFLGFGIAFEVPIATILLVAVGITTPKKLSEKRPYVIVAAFIIGMLLTPPDVISQVLLAFPMWLLFEGGVLASSYLFADRLKQQEEEEAAMAAEEAENEAAYAGGSSFDDDYEVVDDPAEAGLDGEHDEYEPLSEEEMDAELDRMDAEDDSEDEDDEDYEASKDTPESETSTEQDSSEDEDSHPKKDKPVPPSPDDYGP